MSIDRRYRLLKSSVDVTDLVSSGGGFIPTGLLGSGTANASVFLRGDNTWSNTLTQASGGLTLAVSNTSVVDGDTSRIQISTPTSAVALFAANAAQSTAIVTGGPTGAQAVLRNLGAYPLIFGTNNTDRGEIAGTGAWTIKAPTSGTALSVSALATQVGIQINPGDSASVGLNLVDPSGTSIGRLNTTATLFRIQQANASNSLVLATAAGDVLTMTSAGLFTFKAPTSASILATFNANGSNDVMQLASGAVADSAFISIGRNSVRENFIGVSATNQALLTGATVGDLCLRGNVAGVSLGGGSTAQVRILAGMMINPAVTGGDKGAGTINVSSGYFVNGVALAVPTTKVKAAATVRALNVTPSNDPDLVFAVPAAGTYGFEIVVSTFNALAAANGIKGNVNFSGTLTAAGSWYASDVFANSGAIANITIALGTVVTAADFNGSTALASPGTVLCIKGVLTATSAGTLGFSWSQSASAATGSTVQQGSFMTITKLA